MESIRTRPTISAYSPEQTCQRIAKALTNAEDVIKEVNNVEKNSLLSSINEVAKENKWGNIYADEESANIELAKKTLKQLVELVMEDDITEMTLFETEDIAYVLQKNEGTISFCELSYPTEYSLSNIRYLRSSDTVDAKKILCEFNSQELRKNFELYFESESINVDSPFFSLLNNNPRLLEFAAEHIIEKPLQYFNVFKNARCYSQIKKRESEFSQLEFSENRLRLLYQNASLGQSYHRPSHLRDSPNLRIFILTGKKPETEKEISRLFCEFFKITVLKKTHSSDDAGWPIDELPYYQYILQGIAHLDINYLCRYYEGPSDNGSFVDSDTAFIRPLFHFLIDHHEGKSLDLGRLYTRNIFQRLDHGCYSTLLFDLVKSPRLTAIRIVCWPSFEDYVPNFLEALQSNTSITKLTIDRRYYVGATRHEEVLNKKAISEGKSSPFFIYRLTDLAEALKERKTLTSLEIVDMYDDELDGVQALIQMCVSLTSLKIDLYASPLSTADEEMLLATLKENTTLTSFEFPWNNDELRKQCKEHLRFNALAKSHLSKALLLSPLSEQSEGQLVIPREIIRLICAVLWSLTEIEEHAEDNSKLSLG